MAEHWQELVANLAVVALFISTWVHGQFVFAGRPKWQRNVGFGTVMGLGAVASMLLAIPIDGALFDLRLSLLAIAGFFGGPIAGAAAVAIASIYRLGLVGGANAPLAVVSMSMMAVVGWAISRSMRRRAPALVAAGLLALAPFVVSMGWSAVLHQVIDTPITHLSLPVALMNVLATGLSAFFIMRNRVIERERDLLRAAFFQAPDFQYVKTSQSTFAMANMAVAKFNGFDTPQQMIGKSDFDITPRDRAEQLRFEEQKIIRTGTPLIDHEEMIADAAGHKTWYLTSKVPLLNADGEIIGLAGVTRDVTSRRKLRDEAEESRNRLDYVLAGVSDGIAMFDRFGVLVYCNEQHSGMFSLTSALRQPGQHINAILTAVAETREQNGIPVGLEAEWVEEVAATLDRTGEQEIELFDGRWLHVRTRPTQDGSSLVVVSDVTTIKQAEAALLRMTDQLKQLATTDGLTGLVNRRAFDEALASEVARARRAKSPLAVLMVDVDKFKAYNDHYGHPAGDDALKAVARCLKGSVRRPGDLVARYGGEEFVVVLPNTDEDAALFVADAFREALHALKLPHTGSERGMVTASVGIAALTPDDIGLDGPSLVARADEALYTAKHAGRDRVTGWRARHPAPQQQRA